MCHVGDAGLGALAFGDVDRGDQRRRAAVIAEKLRIDGDVDRRAVGLAVPPGAAGLIVGRGRREVGQRGGLARIVQRTERHAQKGLATMAIMRDGGIVHRDDALIVERIDEHRHRI